MKTLTILLVFICITVGSYCNNPINKTDITLENILFQNVLTEEERWALFIGKIYYLTNPIMELDNLLDFDLFILELSGERNVDELFSANSLLIQYMNSAGNKMISTAFNNFDREGADRAYGRAMEMGANMEQAGKIRDSFNSGSVDLLTYGKELLWLAQVLPSYVEGDPTLFNTTATETRRQFRQVKGIIETLGPDTLQYYMNMFQDNIIYEVSLLTYYALYY